VSLAKLDLLKLRAATYEPVDWIARIRTSSNALAWVPVYMNLADHLEYVVFYGQWRLAEDIPGFEKFEELKPIPTKKLYDPHRRGLVDTGIPVDEFREVREEWSTLVQ
jgi:hypothetical protein